MPTLLKDLRIAEVSSVDRGAGEGVKIMLMKRDDDEPYWKRDFSAEQRRAAAESGAAMEDGSFPIKTVGDLENAVRAIGRAKDPAKAKAHIISRARSLGATDKLPDGWLAKGDGTMAGLTDDEKAAVLKAAEVAKAKGKKPPFLEDKEPDGDEGAKAEKEKAEKEKATCKALADGARALAKLSPEHRAYLDGAALGDEALAKFLGADDAGRAAQIAAHPLKKAEIDPEIRKRLDQADADRVELQKLLDERETLAFEKRAIAAGLPGPAGDVLRKAYKGDKEAAAKLEALIKGLSAQVETGKLFAEFGAGGGKAATARDEMNAKVAEYRKANPTKTEAQAFDKVYTDPANVELKKRFDAEEWKGRGAA